MQATELMVEGVNLMLLGMGSVFLFLTLLVVALGLMSRIAKLLSKEERLTLPTSAAGLAQPGVGDEELIAVISAAVSRFRSEK